MSTDALDLQTLSIGLLIARVVIGLLMAAHGAQKLFGWFGGYGLNKIGPALTTTVTLVVLALGIVGGLGNLALRKPTTTTVHT